jgi:hypothetical protein
MSVSEKIELAKEASNDGREGSSTQITEPVGHPSKEDGCIP